MTIEIKAPAFPESVSDGIVSTWHKKAGDSVSRDELLVEIETDKVVMEVVAPDSGVLDAILVEAGSEISSETLLAVLKPSVKSSVLEPIDPDKSEASRPPQMGPAVRALLQEHDIDPTAVVGSGKTGRLLKEDVLAHVRAGQSIESPADSVISNPQTRQPQLSVTGPTSERVEKRVPMTRMRARIAERLLGASQQTAMLTTFNEVNMAPLIKLRNQYREQFEKTHNGTRLGFMGFFVKASCEALKRYPEVNASIDGNDVVYHGYQDVGVAVSVDQGLVVPVLRDADFMTIADIEASIFELGTKAKEKKLTVEQMTGGTFTVSNGGVFGSLLSTPILNPPQTGILGMHAIQERPVALNGEVVIQPMMYLALSYDHRLIDGRIAVQFLVTVKGFIEDPARILLQL